MADAAPAPVTDEPKKDEPKPMETEEKVEAAVSSDAAAAAPAEAKPKKERKPREKKPVVAAVAAAPGEGRPTRERKQVERLQVGAEDSGKAPVIVKGKGTEFSKIDNINQGLEALKGTEMFLKKLYTVIYPGSGRNSENVMKGLLAFSGFANENKAEKKESVVAALGNSKTDELKDMARLLDVETGGDKAAIVDRLADFLFEPTSSGRAFKGVDRKRKTTSKSKGKSGGPKRPPTPYFVYQADVRAKITEIASIIGQMWGKLSDAEKAEYKKRAQAGGSKKADAMSDDSDGSDEEQEGSDEEKPVAKKKPEAEEKAAKKQKTVDSATEAKLKEQVKAIVDKADLSKMTIKGVKTDLLKSFDQETIDAAKEIIKAAVNAATADRTQREKPAAPAAAAPAAAAPAAAAAAAEPAKEN